MAKNSVIITGAGSGIGRATALEFAQNGYFVFLLGRRLDKLQQTAQLISKDGGGALPFPCDLQVQGDLDKTMQAILQTNEGKLLKVLVNNAGTFVSQHFAESTPEAWRSAMESNFFSAVALAKLVYPQLAQGGGGAIVNVSSSLGLRPTANTGAYSAAKAAMVNWTQSLALEGGPHNVRVNCVCPGIVDTPIHGFNALHGEAKEKALQQMEQLQPLQRIGTDREIAKAIYFLGSEQSSWTTGAVLVVDGGINLT